MKTVDFINQAKKLNPSLESGLLKKACLFAQKKYEGLFRLSGQSYLNHCFDIAIYAAKIKLDPNTIITAILHETIDKTDTTKEEIANNFSPFIAELVQTISDVNRIETQINYNPKAFRKLFLATAKDIRVVLLKLINQLYNLKTLHVLDKVDQRKISLQTLDTFAPLAAQLGTNELKKELEDLAFFHVHPKAYKKLLSKLGEKKEENEEYIKLLLPEVKSKLNTNKVKCIKIEARAKGYYSLYQKLLRYKMKQDEISDIIAFRILTPNIKNCYKILDMLYDSWQPLPRYFDDYIQHPKPNGYQSIHASVLCENKKTVEFQIRTPAMHEHAEYGSAAHWCYKKDIQKLSKSMLKEIAWTKQARQWKQIKSLSEEELFQSLKIDLFKDRIFIFTPNNDVIDLPKGSTGLDFAYYLDDNLASRCIGVKIDGKFNKSNVILDNKQIVEVITKSDTKPSKAWLEFVKTKRAKKGILAHLE